MGRTAKIRFDKDLEESYTVASETAASTSSNLESESPLDEICSGQDLSAGDSYYTPRTTAWWYVGRGNFHDERSQVTEDTERQEDEGDEAPNRMHYNENNIEDTIEIDAQEQAMFDLLHLCQDAGTSLVSSLTIL